MGRHYLGDIEGKFWFAVQSSNAADRFGSIGYEPGYLEYCFDEDDLPGVQQELKNIEEIISLENIKKLDDFFNNSEGYNDYILEQHGILDIWNKYKSDYADYILGKKIEKCLLENKECNFQAEL